PVGASRCEAGKALSGGVAGVALRGPSVSRRVRRSVSFRLERRALVAAAPDLPRASGVGSCLFRTPVSDPGRRSLRGIRSSEIESQLAIGFKVLARRPYGGTLLSVIYPSLRPEAISQKLIADLIEQERRLLTELPSYYAVI